MLHLASKALIELLYPMTWAGVFIPVLPARLIQALEAPCPYIVGIERRYEKVELPEDDFVLVDLDQDEIESKTRLMPMPRQQRRKLTSLLQVAAPHHNRYGVPIGPPAYAVESFPFDTFLSENPSIFNVCPPQTSLAKYVSLNSTSFGESSAATASQPPLFNAFVPSTFHHSIERPSTSRSTKPSSPPSPTSSPISTSFPPLPITPVSRNDSGFALPSTLREKRSGHFDALSKRSSTYAVDRNPMARRPSIPFSGHSSNHSSSFSMATISSDGHARSIYAPSTYAQSTLAASTVMPNMLMQPVRNNETTQWMEGHCLQWHAQEDRSTCSICEEKGDGGIYRCRGCSVSAHGRCVQQVCLPCPAAFHPEQLRAAFVRCFASLFYTYRKFLHPASNEQKKSGMLYHFSMDGFLRSLPHENAEYTRMLQQTQGKRFINPTNVRFLINVQVSMSSSMNGRLNRLLIPALYSSIK